MEEESGLLFPKEKSKKKRKKHAKSIVSESKLCFICDRYGQTETHHIFGGANREKSEEYGVIVRLCPYCHRIGDAAVHRDGDTMNYIHLRGQQAFEAKYGHEEFMKVFGKNYIEDWMEDYYGNPYVGRIKNE